MSSLTIVVPTLDNQVKNVVALIEQLGAELRHIDADFSLAARMVYGAGRAEMAVPARAATAWAETA